MSEPQAVSTPPSKPETKEPVTSSPTPIFGAASTFGGTSGFAGFSGATSSAAKPSEAAQEDEEGAEEAECEAEFKPLVQLEEVEVSTGEESENCLIEFKCKLYRFDGEEWKERGLGVTKLLENKENKRIRLLMRQEKTLKIRANHIVMPGTKLQEHAGNEKSWVWTAVDFADEKQKVEMFAMRFSSAERAQEFKREFEKAMEVNAKLLPAAEEGDEEEAEEEQKEDEADKLAAEVEKKATVEA